ncbi:MAG TPA: Dam family site-specific DNA-(adenine-N6)-methyltransferase [Chitinophagaceae bacterium]|jgi:DNA adenine methylase
MDEIIIDLKIKDIKKPKPFLRWTGSKSWLVKNILEKYLPNDYNNYHEPFLGGAAVFFHLLPKKNVFLYDLNEDLINTYLQLKDNIDEVIQQLKKYHNSKEEYYQARKSGCSDDISKAAKFIYLNRTSFNGIYRVNNLGLYNVPYGKRKNVDIVTEENLRLVNKALQGTNICCSDFSHTLLHVRERDLVYLDPPYTVAHENNGFIEYNSKLFSWDDQKKLSELIKEIDNRGAFFILSNAEHIEIRKLYAGVGKIESVSRYSKVGGRNKTRGIFNEIIITNVT